MKCPVCKFSKCRWIGLKAAPEKLSDEELDKIIVHNISFIEMTYRGHQGSALSEERMYNSLAPYTDEQEKRNRATIKLNILKKFDFPVRKK